jgi:hypothetical protein
VKGYRSLWRQIVALFPILTGALAGPSTPAGEAEGEPELSPEEILAKGTPRQVAELHYGAVVADDRDLWVSTIVESTRKRAHLRGASPEFWWSAGRRFADEFGVTYHFHRADREEPEYHKLFFERIHPDGSRRGAPVPIHLVLEADGWRVRTPSY